MQLKCKHIYVLIGQVAYRMTYNQSSHIRVRFGVYHFVRRVPADLQHHYRSDRVSISLRTKSANVARRTAQSICQRLEDYWHGLRLQKMDVPALHLVISDAPDMQDNSPTMMEAVDVYLCLKSDKHSPTFIRAARRNGRYVAEPLGNRPINSYSSADAAAFRVDADIPYVEIRPHKWRRLKTKSSVRKLPLVGASLWAARQAYIASNHRFMFPKYCNETECQSNSASAALNKWLKTVAGSDYVIHSFRHSMRDRLRAVNCPADMIGQIGGWRRKSVGEGYGEGFSLASTHAALTATIGI
jgi:hypothetical protein